MTRTLRDLGIEVANLPRRQSHPDAAGDAVVGNALHNGALNKPYLITAQGDDEDGLHVISITGSIDPWGWAADDLRWELEAIDDDVPIRVKLTSPGGNPFQAFAMYEMLAKRKAEVEIEVQGFAQSAAAFLAMAGDTRRIGELGFFMVHGCRLNDFNGNTQDIDEIRELMVQVDDIQTRLFTAATGQDEETVRGWLTGGDTWFNAERSVEVGLATDIVASEDLTASGASVDLRVDLAAHALSAEKPPHQFVAAIGRLLTPPKEDTTMPETKQPKANADGTDDIKAAVRDALPEVLGDSLPDLLAKALPDAMKAAGLTKPDADDASDAAGGNADDNKATKTKASGDDSKLDAITAKLDALAESQKAMDEAIKAGQAAGRETRISNALDQAQRAGKLPASLRAVWEGTMRMAGDDDAFDKLVAKLKALPVSVPGTDPRLEAELTGLDEGEVERLSATAIPARLLPPGMSEAEMEPSARIAAKKCLAAAAGKTGDEAYDAVRAAWYKQNGGTAPARPSDQPIFGGN